MTCLVRHIIIVKVTFTNSNVGAKPQGGLDVKGLIMRQEKLAIAFYERMKEGQNSQGMSDYRRKFFRKVIKMANYVSLPLFMAFHNW